MRATGAEKPMSEELGLTWIWKDVQSMTRLSRGRAQLAASLTVCLPALWKRRSSGELLCLQTYRWYVAEVSFEPMTGSKVCSCLFHCNVTQRWVDGAVRKAWLWG